MKAMTKALALCLALLMIFAAPVRASAVQVEPEATIDPNKETSLTLFKYDLSNAEKDGVWDSSYVSTGVYDQNVNDTLDSSDREYILGNGEKSYGYAVKGVEFTYRKVADIVQYSESVNDGATDSHVEVLYAVDKAEGADFLSAIGLTDGASRYEKADQLDAAKYFYQSDVLIKALEDALAANSTTVKNALEAYAVAGGTAMPLTDEFGKSEATELELGLYLLVETKVPEQVISTCDPALISLPMTAINTDDAGETWNYDVTIYPKNQTGIVSLEKTLRESLKDTGKHNGSTTDITDGYAHTGTASDGDIIDYQIISTLPAITSTSTYLSAYSFMDTLSKGLTYCQDDVVLEFFSDAACTVSIAKWTEADGKFSVAYDTNDKGESEMVINITDTGLSEVNTSKAVFTEDTMVNSGYSGCTLRITYQAQVNADDTVVYGDSGNPNTVLLLWQRTSQDYYDMLVDDCHLHTYGLELTKLFSDNNGNLSNVEFIIYNKTDDYYVKAKLDETSGIYYVEDQTYKSSATKFVPVADTGKILVKGLEDDEYIITEIKTDNGYTLLRDNITVVISQEEATSLCGVYQTDWTGLVQNDPWFQGQTINGVTQKHLEHHILTASATVDGKDVNMLEDNGSVNAEAPLRVINTKGFTLPKTGDNGVWMYGVIGILLMAGSVAGFVLSIRKKKNSQ